MASPLQPASYTKREYTTLLGELSRIVKATRPTLWTDFYQSNLGQTLMSLVAAMGDITSYGTDAATVELYLAYCQRYESGLRWARSVGYRVRGPQAAQVTMQAQSLPGSVSVYGGYIAKGATFAGQNGYTYELLEAVTIEPGTTDSILILSEGSSTEETFEATGLPNQEVTTAAQGIEDSSWSVFVGSVSDPDNLWKEVDSLSLEREETKSYESRYTASGSLSIRFGNGTDAGKLPDATITIRFRKTNGSKGNAGPGTISGSATVTLIQTPGTVSVNYLSVTSASGGDDREDLKSLRISIPAFLRTSGKILTVQDYEEGVLQVGGVALAICRPMVSSYGHNLVYSYCWGSEPLRVGSSPFVVESPTSGFKSDVDYTRYAQLNEYLPNSVQQFLRTRTPVTVHNVVARPTVAKVDLYLSPVRYDKRIDPAALHTQIVAALVTVFEQSSGFVVRLSDIFRAVEDLPGVLSFNIDRILLSRMSRSYPTGTITFASNPADATTVTVDDGIELRVFEFDNNDSTTGSNVRVAIAGTSSETLNNLINAINGNTNIVASRDPTPGTVVSNLEHQYGGTRFNIPITTTATGVVLLTGMVGGTDTESERNEDYRRDMFPTADQWPEGADPRPVLPLTHPDYATDNGPGDGVAPYRPLQDVTIPDAVRSRNYFDSTYLFNNEIYYDSTEDENGSIQALNLRSVHFEMTGG